jgi:4'-phosphopantetheinyl transferase
MAAGAAVWMACGEPELPEGTDWLSHAESARASGLTLTKRRTEYLLRRWAGKRAVAPLAGLADDPGSLARIEVANRTSGAPVALVDGTESSIDLSLTDRAGWAVCVAGVGLGPVGCDLELVEPRSRGFVSDFLTGTEQSYVASRGPADHDAVVNLIWSAKESGLKVLQTGLRRDSRSLEVMVGDPDGGIGWATLEVCTTESDVLHGWWRRAGPFVLTVVTETALAPPTTLAGSAELADARPLHGWLDHPRAT